MAYFFQDKVYNQKADKGLMRKIVCALHCTMYEVGSYIIEKDEQVDSVHFIFSGYCDLTSVYKIKDETDFAGTGETEDREYGFRIKLGERSWFGDFQVLMQVNSTWNLIARKKDVKDDPLVKIMHIEAGLFRRYVDEYPDFRRFLILRSTVRRAYFNYRMKMCSYSQYLHEKQEQIESTYK